MILPDFQALCSRGSGVAKEPRFVGLSPKGVPRLCATFGELRGGASEARLAALIGSPPLTAVSPGGGGSQWLSRTLAVITPGQSNYLLYFTFTRDGGVRVNSNFQPRIIIMDLVFSFTWRSMDGSVLGLIIINNLKTLIFTKF